MILISIKILCISDTKHPCSVYEDVQDGAHRNLENQDCMVVQSSL